MKRQEQLMTKKMLQKNIHSGTTTDSTFAHQTKKKQPNNKTEICFVILRLSCIRP